MFVTCNLLIGLITIENRPVVITISFFFGIANAAITTALYSLPMVWIIESGVTPYVAKMAYGCVLCLMFLFYNIRSIFYSLIAYLNQLSDANLEKWLWLATQITLATFTVIIIVWALVALFRIRYTIRAEGVLHEEIFVSTEEGTIPPSKIAKTSFRWMLLLPWTLFQDIVRLAIFLVIVLFSSGIVNIVLMIAALRNGIPISVWEVAFLPILLIISLASITLAYDEILGKYFGIALIKRVRRLFKTEFKRTIGHSMQNRHQFSLVTDFLKTRKPNIWKQLCNRYTDSKIILKVWTDSRDDVSPDQFKVGTVADADKIPKPNVNEFISFPPGTEEIYEKTISELKQIEGVVVSKELSNGRLVSLGYEKPKPTTATRDRQSKVYFYISAFVAFSLFFLIPIIYNTYQSKDL